LPWPTELDAIQHWYSPHLDRIHDDAAIRSADLVQLVQIAAGSPSRSDFLTDLTLDPPSSTGDHAGPPLQDEDYLNLSTIHSVKGREFRSVHILNVVDGCIPSDLGTGSREEVEEERRLLHVAMTRAKDELHLVVPQRFYTHGQPQRGDRHVYAPRTRFIPNSIRDLFDTSAWSSIAAPGSTAPGAARPQVDVAAKARAMWT
jgi:DNA helicase-2/ATP-dependent DNA helicase PcrA